MLQEFGLVKEPVALVRVIYRIFLEFNTEISASPGVNRPRVASSFSSPPTLHGRLAHPECLFGTGMEVLGGGVIGVG